MPASDKLPSIPDILDVVPVIPTKEDLENTEAIVPGSAKLQFELYLKRVDNYEERLDLQLNSQIQDLLYIQYYRFFSILAGTILGIGCLGLCAYAVHHKQSVGSIALVLTPLAGLSGVFVWGYRPAATAKAKVAEKPDDEVAKR